MNGSFPLDHHGDCQTVVKEYLACLQRNKEEQTPCKELAQVYFECRKQKGLLNPDDARVLGLPSALIKSVKDKP